MRATRLFAAVIAGLTGLLTAGCFDIEQTLTLEKDLSGKAGFSMKVDMDAMVVFMARMQKEMSGQTGEPTQAELDAARKDFLASKKTSEVGNDFEKDKKEMQGKLPPGVKLLDSSFKEDGLKIAANFLFGFDNVSKLSQIHFPKKQEEGAEGPPGAENPVESPFSGLQVVDEGTTILVTSPTENPLAAEKKQTEQMDLSPEDKKQMEEMFKGLRVAFKITAPFQIVEHNAHRKEGNTLIWEYDLKSLESMKPEQLAQGVRVRYKK